MATHDVDQLRTTSELVADTTPLPDPPVIKAEFVACEDGYLVGRGRSYTTTLPLEAIVRELRDADLDTAHGVALLTQTLGLDLAQSVDLADLGLVDRDGDSGESFLTPPLMIEGWYMHSEPLVGIASYGPGTKILKGAMLRTKDAGEEFNIVFSCGHWQQVAQRLRLVRAAVNHFVAHSEGTDLISAWTGERFDLRVGHEFSELSEAAAAPDLITLRETPLADAWRIFVAVHAQLLREHLPSLTVWLSRERASLKIFAFPSTLASALVVQLHNLIVDGLEIRRCANESCGRPFTRQRGRAAKGQYRSTGVLYCDAACAKAQIQREYRRRNRQRTQNSAV
jgi:hypothetical protein